VAARGLPPIVLFVLLALPRAAAADTSGAFDARIDGVRVADEADGSVVAVKLSAHHRLRLLHSVERLVRIATADVDADGDLDILASTIRERLLLWRNAGRGRFILARLPKARDALGGAAPRASGGVPVPAQDEPGEGNVEPGLPGGASAREPLVLRSFVLSESFSPLAQHRVAPTGRAPPSLD
jgi:hypothetical protein